MKTKQNYRAVVVLLGLTLCAVAGTHAQNSPANASPKTNATPHSAQKVEGNLADDFAGLQYSDEQKAQIDQIQKELNSRRQALIKDQALDADQKQAMLLGYTRLAYGRMFEVLTPEQQRQVRKKISDRRTAQKALQSGKQLPRTAGAGTPAAATGPVK
jgi:Spy/CpxP family protein refolding chaperone